MEQAVETVTPNEVAFELARWYHELARVCVEGAQIHIALSEDSEQADVDRALALNDVIRVRMATVQSLERAFRSEFPKLYIDANVRRILAS